MYTKNGVLSFGKKEKNDMETVIHHALRDLDFGWGGSYGGHDENNTKEVKQSQKEIESAKRGIENIRWIIETYKK